VVIVLIVLVSLGVVMAPHLRRFNLPANLQ
jgi:hypothetical protein